MKNILSILPVFLFAISANASVVAIIDSGTDMKHPDIAPLAWINPVEQNIENGVDEDLNGFIDDIFGWNFAEDDNQVIDYSYQDSCTDDAKKFFAIQARMIKGIATEDDEIWYMYKTQDEDFIYNLSIFGNYMHGTHVAGIASKGNDMAKVLAVKLLATEASQAEINKAKSEKGVTSWLVKKFLRKMAKQQMGEMEKIGKYVASHNADVANGSFGTGYEQAAQVVKAVYAQILNKEPSEEEVKDIAVDFLNALVSEGERFVKAAPNTLFVFAAGNDGTNNDELPSSPTNIRADNVISVAATLENKSLAKFSNFGIKTVDVAAPGVAIESAIPGTERLRVSGTSQAAPYVANVAAKVKDANPKLTPKEIKEIILQTVDKKMFLVGIVKTQGVVNKERAIAAAELTLSMEINEAIKESLLNVRDQEDESTKGLQKTSVKITPIPLAPMFKI